MAYMRHMHPNLMCAAGFKRAFDQRRFGKLLDCPEMGDGMSPLVFRQHSHFFAVCRRPPDLRPNGSRRRGRDAVDDRQIAPFDVVRCKQLGKPFMCSVAFCDNKQSRSVFVDAVHDARSLHAADTRKLATTMVEQRVYQRAVSVAGSRVNDQPRRLVNDNQMLVFIYNIEIDILRLGLVSDRCRHQQFERAPCEFPGRGIGDRNTVDAKALFGHQRLNPRTRKFG